MAHEITAITGGIGCGKSVVSRILRIMGHDVYDCDSNARALMDKSADIKHQIAVDISPEAIVDGHICRPVLAKIVFSDSAALKKLNGIVHSAVRRHFEEWAARSRAPHVWVETAILYESGMNRLVDDVWDVQAPLELRVARVMARNHVGREEVLARIDSQQAETCTHDLPASVILNDGIHPMLPRIIELLS